MAKAPAPDALPDEIARMGFEEAMKELEDIVRRLEGGQVKLDDAVKAYERGAALKRHCEAKLADAKMKVEKITQAGKALGLEPMDNA
jgi:exodeoxyribonuclease VII small subunit